MPCMGDVHHLSIALFSQEIAAGTKLCLYSFLLHLWAPAMEYELYNYEVTSPLGNLILRSFLFQRNGGEKRWDQCMNVPKCSQQGFHYQRGLYGNSMSSPSSPILPFMLGLLLTVNHAWVRIQEYVVVCISALFKNVEGG